MSLNPANAALSSLRLAARKNLSHSFARASLARSALSRSALSRPSTAAVSAHW